MSTKSKTQQAKASKDKAAVSKASSVDLEKVGAAINAAQINVNKTLANIQAELVEKHGELGAVAAAIELKKKEMTDLHGADRVLLSIDELYVDLEKKRVLVAEQIDELNRKAEQEEKDLADSREREEEAYGYSLAQRRKAEQDAWLEKVRVQQAEERDRHEKLERGWKEREAELAKKESDYYAALKKSETFDAEVKKLADAEVAKVTAVLKKDFLHTQQLAEVQNKAELSGLQKDIQAKDVQIATLHAELQDVKQQLKAANEAQIVLAKATVDAAANTKAQADAMAVFTNVNGGNGRTRPTG